MTARDKRPYVLVTIAMGGQTEPHRIVFHRFKTEKAAAKAKEYVDIYDSIEAKIVEDK